MKSVTYEGPENELEQSDYLVVEGVRLPRGQAVKVDDDVAKAAEDVPGHKITVKAVAKADSDTPEAEPTTGQPTPAADDEAAAETVGPGANDQA